MKNAAANDKLKKMVKDQQEAEKKKVLPVPGTGLALGLCGLVGKQRWCGVAVGLWVGV